MDDQTQNPYAPPAAAIVPPLGAGYDLGQYQPASNGKRFLNYMIDRVALMGLMIGVGVLLGILGAAGGPEAFEETSGIADFVVGCLASVFYYASLEGVFGLTLGKLITGTRVVDAFGNKPSFGAILGRTLARFVPFEAFSFFGNTPGGWHDGWSGTMVIDVRNPQKALSPGLRKIYNRY